MEIRFSLIDFDEIFPIQSSIGYTIFQYSASNKLNTRCELLARDIGKNFWLGYIE